MVKAIVAAAAVLLLGAGAWFVVIQPMMNDEEIGGPLLSLLGMDDEADDAVGVSGDVSADCDPSRFVQGESVVCELTGLNEGVEVEIIANWQDAAESFDAEVFFNESFTAGADGVVSVTLDTPNDAARVNVTFQVGGQPVAVQGLLADARPSNGEEAPEDGESEEVVNGEGEGDVTVDDIVEGDGEGEDGDTPAESVLDRDPFIPLMDIQTETEDDNVTVDASEDN